MKNIILKNIVIFMVIVDVNRLLARKFFDNWVVNVWQKKLGICVSFYRMVQKGVFLMFLKDHEMQ